jgi:DNA repair protein RadC
VKTPQQPPLLDGVAAIRIHTPLQTNTSKRDDPAVRVATQPTACTTVELLSQLIAPAIRKDAVAAAAAILNHFNGDLIMVARAQAPELMQIAGINQKAATSIVAALTLGGRVLSTSVDKPTINSPSDAAALLQYDLAACEQEHFRVVLLDTRSQVIHIYDVYQGSLNSSQVMVGEVFKEAIRRCAASILIAHNHPSNVEYPSPDDVSVTRALVQAGKLLGIEVIDHLVIGGGRWVSLRERGLGFS